MDFSDLSRIIKKCIVNKFDHALVLNKNTAKKYLTGKGASADKYLLVEFQPTCENLLLHFAGILRNKFSKTTFLHHLKLRETRNCYAEWFADDNKSK